MTKAICAETREVLREFCASHPHVTHLIESIGAWDFEICVETENQNQVTAIVEQLYGLCGMRIGWVKVLMEVQDFKCSTYPFTDADSPFGQGEAQG
jgi:hypothetical protein